MEKTRQLEGQTAWKGKLAKLGGPQGTREELTFTLRNKTQAARYRTRRVFEGRVDKENTGYPVKFELQTNNNNF